MTENCWDQ